MLDSRQVQHLEKRLLEEREEAIATIRRLESEIEDNETSDGDLTKLPTHLADRASDVQEEDLDTDLALRLSERVSVIDEALERLLRDADHFDISIVSGERIPFERLDLVPWTRRLASEESTAEQGAT